MAHWHDHNPWAEHCLYVSEEAMQEVLTEAGWKESSLEGYGNKLDAYLLFHPQRSSFGIRFGKEPAHYLSPPISNELARKLCDRFLR